MEITITKKLDANNTEALIKLNQIIHRDYIDELLSPTDYLSNNEPIAEYTRDLHEILKTKTDDGADMINLRIAINEFTKILDRKIEAYYNK